MTHYATRICTGLLCGILISAAAARAQQIPPGENLFPKTAQGFIAITNVDALIDHFNKTQLGKLAADPVMKPFTEDVKRQFENRWSSVHERLGVTLDDLRDVPGGEVCIGLIKPAKDEAAIALTVDITGRLDQAKAMLEKVNKNLLSQGAKRTEIKSSHFKEPIIQYLLPEREEDREAMGSAFSAKPNAAKSATPDADAPAPRYAFYFTTGNFLCASDHQSVMSGILARFAGKGAAGDSLAEVEGFRSISERCASDAGEVVPQIRWFIYPIGYVETARAATPAENRRKGKTLLAVMKNQGFGAIQGVGGYASFSDENFDLIHRTSVYAPEPYEKSMKMLKFINGADYAPQVWVPRDVATYSTVYFNIQNAFENFGPMFNELYGGGDEDYWKSVLEDLKDDPHSARLDIEKELIAFMGERITVVTDYQMPITTKSERIMIAIEVKDEAAVAKGIAKWMNCDPNAKREEIDGRVVWEIVEDESNDVAPPSVDFGATDEPSLNVPQKKPPKEEKLFPHRTVTVAHKNLFIASHKDFLEKILEPKQERQLLRNDADYQLVSTTIKNMLPTDKCAGVFSRTDEEYHTTYELIRQNKMPESETLLGRLLNQLFGEGKKVRSQKIDGSQLPEYDAVRRYLGPAGLQATAEKDGWFIKGFTISKELPAPELKEELKEEPKVEPKEEPKDEPKDEDKPAAKDSSKADEESADAADEK